MTAFAFCLPSLIGFCDNAGLDTPFRWTPLLEAVVKAGSSSASGTIEGATDGCSDVVGFGAGLTLGEGMIKGRRREVASNEESLDHQDDHGPPICLMRCEHRQRKL